MPFVIRFSDGAYNQSNAKTGANGFPVTLSEATRYASREEAEPFAADLCNPDGTGAEVIEAPDEAASPEALSAGENPRARIAELEAKLKDALGTVSILYHALDDASSVVDKGADEDYAYQAELETGAALLGIQRR